MFEKEINYICGHFRKLFYNFLRDRIAESLARFFGANEVQNTETALNDLDSAVTTGTGFNTCEIVPIEEGEYRFKYRLEFTIKVEYLGLIPVLAKWLGYVPEPEPETDLPNEGE